MRRRKPLRRRRLNQPFVRTNERIFAPEVRLIGQDGTQLGIVPIAKAREQAREAGVDLVEIAPKAKPPVAKLIDFQKYKYERAKREKELKKKAHTVEVKEIRLGPFISDHDLETRLRKANEFLGQGDRIRFVVKFKGRQMARREYGRIVMDRVMDAIGNRVEVTGSPRFEGRRFVTLVSPVKGTTRAEDKEQKISAEKNPDHQNRQAPAPQIRTQPPEDGKEQDAKASGEGDGGSIKS